MVALVRKSGGEFLVNTQTAGSQFFGGVDAWAMGGFVATWLDQDHGLRAQRFDNAGAKLGGEIVVNSVPFTIGAVAALASGGFVVVAVDSGAGSARIFDAAGVPVGGAIPIDLVAADPDQLNVFALASGGFVVNWWDKNGHDIEAQIFDAAGARVGAEILVNSGPAGLQNIPAGIALQSGGFVITWTDQEGDGSDSDTSVRGQLFDAGGNKVGGNFLINTVAAGSQADSDIAALANGGFVVTWKDNEGPDRAEVQIFDALGNKVGAELLASTPGQLVSNCSVTALPWGGFLVSWDNFSPNVFPGNSIRARLFDADGNKLGQEFTVNSATVEANSSVQLTTLATGEVVALWTGDDLQNNGVKAQILRMPTVGTAGDDILIGGAGDNSFAGLGGNDQIDGGAGADAIEGNAGDDQIWGGTENDQLDGGAGQDSIHGDEGNDTLTATGGTGDWLMGGEGQDVLTAAAGSFNMFGDEGDDVLTLTLGGTNSWLVGGDGNDVIDASGTGMLAADGGAGRDRITIQGFTSGGANLAGNDLLRIPTGLFTLNLLDGSDAIIMTSTGTGFITLIGFDAGEAGDRLDLSIYGADPFGAGVLVMSQTSPDTVIDHVASGMRYVLQNVVGANLSAFNLGVPNPNYAPQDMVIDDAFADNPTIEFPGELFGADGNDLVRGHGGDDRLYGSGGNDRLEGGSGADQLVGGSGNDQLAGDLGNDNLSGGSGNDAMSGGAGNDVYIVDSAGDTVVEAAGGGTDIVYSAVSYSLNDGSEVESLSTITWEATNAINLTGNNLVNTLIGNAGVNQLNGRAGADTMIGREGNDTYLVDNAGDKPIELAGQGTDTVYTSVSYTLAANTDVEGLATISFEATNTINLTGNGLANNMIGNDGANQLDGKAGADTMTGRAGNDKYLIDNAGDRAFEAAGGGYDVVYSAVSFTLTDAQELEGLSTITWELTNAINLTGNKFNNYLIGNAGMNVLDGKAGNDAMQGREGVDTYAFTSVLGPENVDVILGFSSADDTILLENNGVFVGLAGGALNANAFVIGTAAQDSSDRIVYDQATGRLFFDADGNGAGAQIQFARLDGAPIIAANDFTVI